MSRTIDEILNDDAEVVSETSGEAAVPSSPPQLRLLTFNNRERRHQKFLWLFVPLVLVLVVLI